MNSTSSDWSTQLRQSFDHLHPSGIPSFGNTHTHEILVIIGFIAVCLLLLLLIIQFCIKVRDIYRKTEPKKSSSKSQSRYPSYQKLLDTDKNQCKCFHYSCLPKLQCTKPTYQILNSSRYYEQINERQINNSIYKISPSRHIPCIHIHTVK